MVDLKYLEERPEDLPTHSTFEKPEYPYGTKIFLDEKVLQKFEMGDLPEIGAEFTLRGKAYVCATRENKSDGVTDRCLDLQITDLELFSKKSDEQKANEMYNKPMEKDDEE